MMRETDDKGIRFSVEDLANDGAALRKRGASRARVLNIISFEADYIGRQISTILSKVSK